MAEPRDNITVGTASCASIYSGDAARLSATFKNAEGELTTPTTAVIVVIDPALRAGVISGAAIIEDSDGQLHADWTPTQSGRHTIWWIATGGVEAQARETFEVLLGQRLVEIPGLPQLPDEILSYDVATGRIIVHGSDLELDSDAGLIIGEATGMVLRGVDGRYRPGLLTEADLPDEIGLSKLEPIPDGTMPANLSGVEGPASAETLADIAAALAAEGLATSVALAGEATARADTDTALANEIDAVEADLLDDMEADRRAAMALPIVQEILGAVTGRSAIRKTGATEFEVHIPVAGRTCMRLKLRQGTAGRRYAIREATYVDHMRRIWPLTGKDITTGGGGFHLRYNADLTIAGLPGRQDSYSGGAWVERTSPIVIPEGGGPLYLYSMGRPSATQLNGSVITITPADPDARIDWGQLASTIDTSQAAEQTWAWHRIGWLPAGSYTIRIGSGGGFAASYPTLLGLGGAEPFVPENEWVRVAPKYGLHGKDATWTNLVDTSGPNKSLLATSITMTDAAGNHLLVGSDDVHDGIDLVFSAANAGGGTLVAEYSTGPGTWAAHTIRRNTMGGSGGQMGGNGQVDFAFPANWVAATINGVTAFWTRLRCSANTTPISISQCWIRRRFRTQRVELMASNEPSEWEKVFCRFENDGVGTFPEADIGSDHGNSRNHTFGVYVNGRDRLAELNAGQVLLGESIRFDQAWEGTVDSAAADARVAVVTDSHVFIPGGFVYPSRAVFDLTTTLSQWAYSGNTPLSIPTFQPSHVDWIYETAPPKRVAIPVTIGLNVKDDNAIGYLIGSAAHSRQIGVVLLNARTSRFGGRFSSTPAFVQLSSATRLKGYLSSSSKKSVPSDPDPKTLQPGEVWESCVLFLFR